MALKLYADYLLSEDLSKVQSGPISRTILQTLALMDGCSVSEIAKAIDVSLTKLSRYLAPLSDADLVLKKDGKYYVRDRMLQDYLKFES